MVRLRQGDSFWSETALTVHDMIMGTAIKYANYIALGSKLKEWHLLTYIEYKECPHAAKAFLKGSLMDVLWEVKPNIFYGILWIWRWLDDLKTSQLASTSFRRMIDKCAIGLGLRTHKRRMLGQVHELLCFSLAKKLIFNQARKFLGLHCCQQFFNMGLGLPRATLDYFLSLDMPIFQLYGLSARTGVHSLSYQQDFWLLRCLQQQAIQPKGVLSLSVACLVPGSSVASRGLGAGCDQNIFMGYLNDEETAQEKTDLHGWMQGDLGFLDTEESLYIMGNVRGEQDTIMLCSGEINPNPTEERVRKHIPIVCHVVLVGQDAPYLCALLTLRCQINADTEPRNALTSEAIAFCRQLSSSTRLSDIVYNGDPVITEFTGQGIGVANAETTLNSTKITKWTILETDFSMVGGELGATTMLKRATVAKIHQAETERLYKEGEY
ncbi:LOW QUALITY PROTEIN: long-chain-fatty-acid--CoA ligase ACSBG2 [Hipposideros larvatus]